MQDDVLEHPAVDPGSQVGAVRLSPSIGGRSRIEKPHASGTDRVPGNVTVTEDQQIGLREVAVGPQLATGALTGLVDHRDPQAVQVHPGDLR